MTQQTVDLPENSSRGEGHNLFLLQTVCVQICPHLHRGAWTLTCYVLIENKQLCAQTSPKENLFIQTARWRGRTWDLAPATHAEKVAKQRIPPHLLIWLVNWLSPFLTITFLGNPLWLWIRNYLQMLLVPERKRKNPWGWHACLTKQRSFN